MRYSDWSYYCLGSVYSDRAAAVADTKADVDIIAVAADRHWLFFCFKFKKKLYKKIVFAYS